MCREGKRAWAVCNTQVTVKCLLRCAVHAHPRECGAGGGGTDRWGSMRKETEVVRSQVGVRRYAKGGGQTCKVRPEDCEADARVCGSGAMAGEGEGGAMRHHAPPQDAALFTVPLRRQRFRYGALWCARAWTKGKQNTCRCWSFPFGVLECRHHLGIPPVSAVPGGTAPPHPPSVAAAAVRADVAAEPPSPTPARGTTMRREERACS